MSSELNIPGAMIDLRQFPAGDVNSVRPLIRTEQVRISHVLIPAGQEIPTHEAEGEVILHCLRGRITVTALGETCDLEAGQLLYLAINEPFSTRGIEDAALLMTIIQPKQGANAVLIGD